MFIKWSTGCCPVSHSSVTDHRRNRSRKVYYRSWRKDTVKGFMGSSRQSTERRHDLGLIPLLEWVGRVLWGFPARSGLSSLNQRVGFGKPHSGIISGMHKAYGCWQVGGTVEVKSGAYICLWLQCCYPGRELAGEANVSFKSLQTAWPNKMDVEAVISWISLAKLLTLTIWKIVINLCAWFI